MLTFGRHFKNEYVYQMLIHVYRSLIFIFVYLSVIKDEIMKWLQKFPNLTFG